MPSLSARKLIFLWKQKEFPYLGFAITNIQKILPIYKFVGRFLGDISGSFREKSLWHLQNIKNERALHKIQKVGNDMATVLISAFCSALHSNNSSAAKVMRICE